MWFNWRFYDWTLRLYLGTFLSLVMIFVLQLWNRSSYVGILYQTQIIIPRRHSQIERRWESFSGRVLLICWFAGFLLCRITCSFRLRLTPGRNLVTLKAEAARSFEAPERTRYTHDVKPHKTVIWTWESLRFQVQHRYYSNELGRRCHHRHYQKATFSTRIPHCHVPVKRCEVVRSC